MVARRRRKVVFDLEAGELDAHRQRLVEVSVEMARRVEAVVDEAAVEALGRQGWFSRDLLETTEVRLARAAVDGMLDAGVLREAAISRGGSRRVDRDERSDLMAWLEPDTAPAELQPLLAAFEALRVTMNRAAWMGLERFEVQAACYDAGGARYARHRDAFPGTNNRRLTAIIYLNPHWQLAHGGQLRVYVPGDDPDDGERAVDIEPRGGRLVVFLAEDVEHEVLPAHARRCAVSGWFYGRGTV